MATITRTTLTDFLHAERITMADPEWVDRNPNMADDEWSRTARHFKLTVKRGRQRMTVYFSQGPAHEREPELADVLDCLAMDAAGFENAQSFEDWCGEYGYDTDSRKAEKLYRVVEREAVKLRAFLGEDGYERLLWHTERE